MNCNLTPHSLRWQHSWATGTVGSLLVVGVLAVSAAAAGPTPPAKAGNPVMQQHLVWKHPDVVPSASAGPLRRQQPLAAGFLAQWRAIVGPGMGEDAGIVRFVSQLAAQLKLTDEQYKTIQSDLNSLRSDVQPIVQQLKQERANLAKLWNANPLDESKILATSQKITQLQIEMHKKIQATTDALVATLTPEQQKQWQAWQKAAKERLQERQKQLQRIQTLRRGLAERGKTVPPAANSTPAAQPNTPSA